MDFPYITQNIATWAIELGKTALSVIALWIIGTWLIRLAVKLTERAMNTQKIDRTVIGYIGSTMTITLKILLVVGILGYIGIQTTTFAAMLAAIGLAIGAAWSGLLSNFAAGAFLIILHPFKTGDVISAGGVTGKVEEVGLFVTTFITIENVRVFVGNNKIFSDNIQNFSATDYIKANCKAQIDHTTDHNLAIQLLKERVSRVPQVLPHPEPEIGIESFTTMGPVLAVHPCCHRQDLEQVTSDTNRVIRETFGDADFQIPKQHFAIKQ